MEKLGKTHLLQKNFFEIRLRLLNSKDCQVKTVDSAGLGGG